MQTHPKIEISIVVPLFNERENLGPLYAKIQDAMAPITPRYEVVFVDDGSLDGTFNELKRLHEGGGKGSVKIVKLKRNFGQTAALQAGFSHAEGEIIITMDGDLQNDPGDIQMFLEKLHEGYDLVSGWRKERKEKLLTRRIPSKVANWLIGMLTGVKLHDHGCTLRAYRRSVVKSMNLYSDMHRFIPALAIMSGARFAEVIVKHHPRKFGMTKYGISRTWKVFFDLIVLQMITRSSANPLIWFAILGVPPLFFGFMAMFKYLLVVFTKPLPPGEMPIIFLGVTFLFFSLSTFLIFSGLMAEYIILTRKSDPGYTQPVINEEIF